MKVSYHDDSSGRYWFACTDKGGYNGVGATVEAAVANLAGNLEKELGEADADDE